MLTFESRTSSPLQQREWELSYSLRIIGALRLPLLFRRVLLCHPMEGILRHRRRSRTRGGGGRWGDGERRLVCQFRSESSELAVAQHCGLCSLAKGCLLQAAGSGLRRPASGELRRRRWERKQEERGNIQKVPSGTELPHKQER